MSAGSPRLRIRILDTGYCLVPEALLIQGGSPRRVACHSIVAVIHHPEHGWALWDAGYAPRVMNATAAGIFRLYRWATPLRLDPSLAVIGQLPRLGIDPKDIRSVIISHFHADHIGGLRDFPWARIITTQAAYEQIHGLDGWAALRRAFIPALMPPDFRDRVELLSSFSGAVIPHLGRGFDLFGDGTAMLLDLPGHARGQIGLLAATERGPVLLAADACWLTRSIDENRPPSRLADLIADDASGVRSTLGRLHDLRRDRPDITVIPSHCPVAFAREVWRPQ